MIQDRTVPSLRLRITSHVFTWVAMTQVFAPKMEPIKIDWNKFIQAGFEKPSEVTAARSHLKKYGAEVTAQEGNLFLREMTVDGKRIIAIVCRCGNARMTMHDLGIRCQMCGGFHTHTSYINLRDKAKQKAKFQDKKLNKNPQPYFDMAATHEAKVNKLKQKYARRKR